MKKAPIQKPWLTCAELVMILLPVFWIAWQSQFPDLSNELPYVMLTISMISLFSYLLSYWLLSRSNNDSVRRHGSVILMVHLIMEYACLLGFGFAWQNSDIKFSPVSLMNVGLGLMFIILGNSLPKLTPNTTMGIRTRWTLDNRENWNITSRISGYVWVFAGLLLWLLVLLQAEESIIIPFIIITALLPEVISWLVYRKQKKEGTWNQQQALDRQQNTSRLTKWFVVGSIVLTIGLCAVLIWTGKEYSITCSGNKLSIETSLAGNADVSLSQIQSIALKEAGKPGSREWGYSAMGIDLGRYRNAEYGTYFRATSDCPVVIEVVSQDRCLVFSLQDQVQTEALFQELCQKTQQVNPAVKITEKQTQ